MSSTVKDRSPGVGPEPWQPPPHLGAQLNQDGSCSFRFWAPLAEELELLLHHPERRLRLERGARGYYEVTVPGVTAGTRYSVVLDHREQLPDPASRWQPEGVHGPSAVVSHEFDWSDRDWRGVPLEALVIYELHVGTFTPEATFEAIIPRLPELRSTGITAIELMPIAQFSGARNWGYDGVFPFAAQSSYGGPDGLRKLVDAAHAAGLAVILDVVYNHLGPEGNYLPHFGPYITDRYHTPWGGAINFDGPDSDEVRAFFIASALQWLEQFHIDGLRLDAVHAIIDHSAYPFLEELGDQARALAERLRRNIVLIAESDLADPRVIADKAHGGLGMDAQWTDDFHHALHALLTPERDGYYADFGDVVHLARAFEQAYVYAGEYSPYRARRHGRRVQGLRPEQVVVFAQNHDQIGNRRLGDRLATLVDREALKLASAATLLSPYLPLLFMGEEYGEHAPFPYFVSHTDEALALAVREGRREEFAAFGWSEEPPDPLAESTSAEARLRWEQRERDGQAELLRLTRELLRVRRAHPALTRFHRLSTSHGQAAGGERVLSVLRSDGNEALLLLLNFGERPAPAALPGGAWSALLDTGDRDWGGPGPGRIETGRYQLQPWSAALLRQDPT